jgi:WD40 repeat protein
MASPSPSPLDTNVRSGQRGSLPTACALSPLRSTGPHGCGTRTEPQPFTEPLKHERAVSSASFSSDGTRVVTASFSGRMARVWDARTGQPLTEPLKHEGGVKSASFSPDGTRVVTASDKSARVWDIASDQNSAPAWVSSLFDQIAEQHLGDEASFPVRRITGVVRYPAVGDSQESRTAFARWLAADRDTRTMSPRLLETIPQYIDRRLTEGSEEAINEAFMANPLDPLVLIAKAGFEEDPARADFRRHYAVEHFGEQSATTWGCAAEMMQEQTQLELALRVPKMRSSWIQTWRRRTGARVVSYGPREGRMNPSPRSCDSMPWNRAMRTPPSLADSAFRRRNSPISSRSAPQQSPPIPNLRQNPTLNPGKPPATQR